MTSDVPREAYVWVWLPDAIEPVVAGRLERVGEQYVFNYGQSYLQRENAIALYETELPLREGSIYPIDPLQMASCLRDGSPDAWGRRVIISRATGLKSNESRQVELDELTYLLESGSDRIGALDFQVSANEYVSRETAHATLEELQESAVRVQNGELLNRAIDLALHHGSSVGGARPKVLIDANDCKYIAKFSATDDVYSVVGAEFIAMRLAFMAGLDVASVKLQSVAHKQVLLIERFDRVKTEMGWIRRSMVSALTLFGLDEQMARYASYEEFADIIRARFTNHVATLHELFARLTFNILVGNIDDHARNHAAFWDGEALSLTPAYDICPQSRIGREASQAMQVNGTDNRSQLRVALASAPSYQLDRDSALHIIRNQILCIRKNWHDVCATAGISKVDKSLFWRLQFLNPYAFEGLENALYDVIDGLE